MELNPGLLNPFISLLIYTPICLTFAEGEHLAIREAFLRMEGEFTSMDIYSFINKNELAEKIPIDNIVDALERFQKKGELQVTKEDPPRKYQKLSNLTDPHSKL